MSKERVRIIVHGKVQGVFYRARTIETAIDLKVNGWVMNRVDGKVEVVAEGERVKLENLVNWCRKGPKHAHITELEIFWEPFLDEFKDFKVQY